jgi:hypothetical protein
MAGGVSEWCANLFDASGELRTLRGGAWGTAADWQFDLTNRFGSFSENINGLNGFRVICRRTRRE